jgi:hypothetical protein
MNRQRWISWSLQHLNKHHLRTIISRHDVFKYWNLNDKVDSVNNNKIIRTHFSLILKLTINIFPFFRRDLNLKFIIMYSSIVFTDVMAAICSVQVFGSSDDCGDKKLVKKKKVCAYHKSTRISVCGMYVSVSWIRLLLFCCLFSLFTPPHVHAIQPHTKFALIIDTWKFCHPWQRCGSVFW